MTESTSPRNDSQRKRELETGSSEEDQPQRKMFRRTPPEDSGNSTAPKAKRDHHNFMERQRRTEMDVAFGKLGEAIGVPNKCECDCTNLSPGSSRPTCRLMDADGVCRGSKSKASRVTIVNGASAKIRSLAGTNATFANFEDSFMKRIAAMTRMVEVLDQVELSQDERDRRVSMLITKDMIDISAEGDPMAPWNDIVEDLDHDELKDLTVPFISEEEAEEIRANNPDYKEFARRQHAQNMKYKTLGMTNTRGDVDLNADHPDDEDDDEIYEEDSTYQADFESGSGDSDETAAQRNSGSSGTNSGSNGNSNEDDGGNGAAYYDDDDDDDDENGAAYEDDEDDDELYHGSGRDYHNYDEASDDGYGGRNGPSDPNACYIPEHTAEPAYNDDEEQNDFDGFQHGDRQLGQWVKQEITYEDPDREDYEGDDESEIADSDGNEEQVEVEQVEGEGSWEDCDEEEEEEEEGEDEEVYDECDIDIEDQSQDEEEEVEEEEEEMKEEQIAIEETVIKTELDDVLTYDEISYIDPVMNTGSVDVYSEVTVKSEVGDSEDL